MSFNSKEPRNKKGKWRLRDGGDAHPDIVKAVGLVHTPTLLTMARGGKKRRRHLGRAALYAKARVQDILKYTPTETRDDHGRWSAGGSLKGTRPSRHVIRTMLREHGHDTGTERGIVQTQRSGKVFADIPGDKDSVPLGAASRGVILRRIVGRDVTVYHNHPGGGNPSGADIGVAIQMGGKHVVYTSGGSIYHYRSLHRPHSALAMARGNFVEHLAPALIPGMVASSPPGESARTIAHSLEHGVNLALKDKGWIDYRFRMSPKDKQYTQDGAVQRARDMANARISEFSSKTLQKDLTAESVHIPTAIGNEKKRRRPKLSLAYMPPGPADIEKFAADQPRDADGRFSSAGEAARQHLHQLLGSLGAKSKTKKKVKSQLTALVPVHTPTPAEAKLHAHVLGLLTGAKRGDVKGEVASLHNTATYMARRAREMPAGKRGAWLRQKLAEHGVHLDAPARPLAAAPLLRIQAVAATPAGKPETKAVPVAAPTPTTTPKGTWTIMRTPSYVPGGRTPTKADARVLSVEGDKRDVRRMVPVVRGFGATHGLPPGNIWVRRQVGGKTRDAKALQLKKRIWVMLKRKFSADRRRKLAQTGAAMPGGRYPITSARDVANAVRLRGHSSDSAAVRRHIISEAKAIGATGELPPGWVQKRVREILRA